MKWKKRYPSIVAITLCVLLAGCSNNTAEKKDMTGQDILSNTESNSTAGTTLGDTTAGESTQGTSVLVLATTAELFTSRDTEIGYSESDAVKITLDHTTATTSSDAVTIQDSVITIKKEGTYLVTGSLENGQIIIDADGAKVQIVLSDASIHSNSSAPIYIKKAEKAFITINGTNELSTTGEYVAIDDNNIDSVIFSKSDFTLNGDGKLIIKSATGHGIVGKDDLKITSGTYEITAASHGISANDSIRLTNSNLTIVAGKDAIHADVEDTTKGNVYIFDGTYHLTADGDGISASNQLQIAGGDFVITSGGGHSFATPHTNNGGMMGFGGFGKEQTNTTTSTTEDTTTSMKGLKASGQLYIENGTFKIDSNDDAIHSNADVTIVNGTFEIATGDDGVHADSAVLIEAGTLLITESYEGLEGQTITINGGNIELTASDDGVNASGGNDNSGMGMKPGAGFSTDTFNTSTAAHVTINGGKLIVNAAGDGLDSNGNLYITGGEVYVNGPEDSGNGALDYDGTGEITGGTLVAVGSSGMAQNMSSSSIQGCILYNLNSTQSAGSTITIKDASGTTIVSYTPTKSYQSVVISAPMMKQGETYTLTAGNEVNEISMDSLLYSNGGGGGFGGGRGGKGQGGCGGDRTGNKNTPPMQPDQTIVAP